MLSKEQQQQILDYEWIINTVCKKLGITDNDIRSELMLFMCQTIEKYDQTKGVKLGTYLYSSVYLRALRLLSNQRKYKNKNIFISYVMVTMPQRKNKSIIYECVETPEEQQVLTYIIQGYKRREISAKMSIKSSQVKKIYDNYVDKMRVKYQNEPKIDI